MEQTIKVGQSACQASDRRACWVTAGLVLDIVLPPGKAPATRAV